MQRVQDIGRGIAEFRKRTGRCPSEAEAATMAAAHVSDSFGRAIIYSVVREGAEEHCLVVARGRDGIEDRTPAEAVHAQFEYVPGRFDHDIIWVDDSLLTDVK